MSTLGELYDRVYAFLCGAQPFRRFTHFQWLATRELYRDLQKILPKLGGDILDLGCGTKPYKQWFRHPRQYVGADIAPLPTVDVVLTPGAPLPFDDNTFDTVLCTQVLEHVRDHHQMFGEILRILRPGGTLVISVPLLFNVHGVPHDYQRLTEYGMLSLLEQDYEILELRQEGAIGSTLAILLLNWIEMTLNRNRATRLAKGLLLPGWLLLCCGVNLLGVSLDALDTTNSFYSNVLATAKKRLTPPPRESGCQRDGIVR